MKTTKSAEIFVTILAIITIFIILGSYLVYRRTGYFGFHWSVIRYILAENLQYLLWLIIILIIGIYFIVRHYKKTMAGRKNCQVQWVDLATISAKWVESEDVTQTIQQTAESKIKSEQSKNGNRMSVSDFALKVLYVKENRTKEFIEKTIYPIIEKINATEVAIIVDLILLLDRCGKIPSVASLYAQDPEKQIYGDKTITTSGKTSYQVLSEFTLLDHSLRVAETALELYKNNASESGLSLMFGRIIIMSLAHDIGKIYNFGKDEERFSLASEMYTTSPHEKISYMMFREVYPDYAHTKDIVNAISSHHIYKVEGSLAVLLKDADTKAREIEITTWLRRNRIAVAEKTNVAITSSRQGEGDIDEEYFNSVEQSAEVDDNNVEKSQNIDDIEDKNNKVSAIHMNEQSEPFLPTIPAEKTTVQNTKRKKSFLKNKKDDAIVHEYDFIQAHGEAIATALREKINYVDLNMSEQGAIISISFEDLVLYNYTFFRKVVSLAMKANADKGVIEKLLVQFKDSGITRMLEPQSGYTVSKFILEKQSGKEEHSFVPISCEFLGVTQQDLDTSKRENPLLRTINVMTYTKGR